MVLQQVTYSLETNKVSVTSNLVFMAADLSLVLVELYLLFGCTDPINSYDNNHAHAVQPTVLTTDYCFDDR